MTEEQEKGYEALMKLSMLEKQAGKIQEKMEVINQEILEFEKIKGSLDELKGKKEILANLGRGIFVNCEIKDKEMLVNIGSNVVLKKSIDETKKIIDKQISELERIKDNLEKEIEKISLELRAVGKN